MPTSLFSDVKILDLSRVFSGPFATLQFANYGAEVLKIESPAGDESRKFPPLKDGWSGYFELINHNKKSLILDLKNKNDLQHFYQLCAEADVLVENFTPDVKKRLQIDYQTIKKYNEKIIYASICGVSKDVNKKYYDIIAQAESGFASLNGTTDDMKVATSIIDAFAGMKLAFAISSALYAQTKNGTGTHITVSMKGSAFDLLEQNLIETSVTHKNPDKVGNMDNAIAPFGLFKTQDGNIALAVGNDKLWQKLEMFLTEHTSNFPSHKFKTNAERLKYLPLLQQEIETVFSQFSTAELDELLSAQDIPCGQVKAMLDVLADQENHDQLLLENVNHPDIGEITLPTGGIFFSTSDKVPYQPAPELPNEN